MKAQITFVNHKMKQFDCLVLLVWGLFTQVVKSDQLLQNESKHQIMNVHTKWNCLVSILSSLVKYYLFQAKKCHL